MPYVSAAAKVRLATGGKPQTAGELTYCITRQVIDYLEYQRVEGGLHYQSMAEAMGALEGAKYDMQVRLLEPYEARAMSRNGDVWPDTLLDLVHR